jgi:peptidyl-prolyl cis-trans isomerase B (cyclophilin B)
MLVFVGSPPLHTLRAGAIARSNAVHPLETPVMRFLPFIVLTFALAAPTLAAGTPKKTATTKPVKDVAMQQIDEQIAKAKVDTKAAGWRNRLPMPASVPFDTSHTYFARMETNKGPILIQFLPQVAPMHVTNFIYLTRLGFYDGLSFHRVIPGFMAQGGDPNGDGRGGPGYGFGGEFSPSVKHETGGLLSMANAGPGTDGSQFFLTFVATPWLDGKHTIFGRVVEGMETLKALEAAGSQSGATSEPLRMNTVTIEVR